MKAGLPFAPQLTELEQRLAWHIQVLCDHDVRFGCRGCDDDDPQCRGYYECGCGEAFPNRNWVVDQIAQHMAQVAAGTWEPSERSDDERQE